MDRMNQLSITKCCSR